MRAKRREWKKYYGWDDDRCWMEYMTSRAQVRNTRKLLRQGRRRASELQNEEASRFSRSKSMRRRKQDLWDALKIVVAFLVCGILLKILSLVLSR